MEKHKGGLASTFDIRYLRFNLMGTKFKGSTIIRVTNRYIVTELGVYKRKGLHVNFIEKEGSLALIVPDTSYDGCMDI